MKFTVTRPIELDIAFVRISIPVRDEPVEEGGMLPNFPFRRGNTWTATIAIEGGRIQNWAAPGTFQLFEKVVDEGTYELLDGAGKVLAKIENDYVPNRVVPGEYGDYVDLEIVDGVITNWPEQPNPAEFFKEEEA
jgi:hypothetical protein